MTPIGGQVATGLLYWTACRLELWDSDAVFITQNWDVGENVDQLDLNRATVSSLTCSLVRWIYSFYHCYWFYCFCQATCISIRASLASLWQAITASTSKYLH